MIRFERGVDVPVLASIAVLASVACTRLQSEDDSPSTPAGGSVNVGGQVSTGKGGGSNGGTASNQGGASHGQGGGAKGGSSSYTTGTVPACVGLPTDTADSSGAAGACNGIGLEVEPIPVDMIILMDRSISNSYAVGSEDAASAQPGEMSRWQVLTSAMAALANAPNAAKLGASITFFSVAGGNSDVLNCDEAQYSTPVVPLGPLSTTGPQIVAAMGELTPSGLTPTVPALTGAYYYAMEEKQKNPSREKVLVLISDGFPTQCTMKSPSDVTSVIRDAASATIPIRTFVIGVGSPGTIDAARFNLQNYATAGKTGKPPYLLDETASASAVSDQLVTALLNIAASPVACEYQLEPPKDYVVDPNRVKFTYDPIAGNAQEIPRALGPADCTTSVHGGWYFDDNLQPTRIQLCPCSCANLSAGMTKIVYGCLPRLTDL